ncbi:MAG: hypothetical protein NC122_02640 [Faecalibacterium sp.]|nr:hypothetical protein [Ruminococcus sp.]MCM1391959.1 hypothetical protein [Ruminococcus sp.]MCM1485082.1 hypothetical protein [Faecalibacterium sp.]
MNQKKIFQIIAIAVAALWIACIVTVISVKVERKRHPDPVTLPDLTTSAPPTAFAPATTNAPTTEPSAQITIDGNNVVTSAQVGDPQWLIDQKESEKVSEALASIPKTKTEIVGAYITAVNNLKEEKRFTLVKTDKLNVAIDEMNPSNIKTIVTTIINNNTKDEPVTYRFANGIDAANTADSKSPNQVIAPYSESASLDESLVKSATAKKVGSNGSYKITIKLGKQNQTLDKAAKGYSTVMQTIAVDEFMPSNASISKMNITYNNGTIEATIDNEGRLTSIKHFLEVTEATGSGKYLLANVELKMHGDYTGTYEISY